MRERKVRNGRNVVKRFGKGFDKDSQRIEKGVKATDCWLRSRRQSTSQPVDSFLSMPFAYSASRLTPFCRDPKKVPRHRSQDQRMDERARKGPSLKCFIARDSRTSPSST